MDSRYGVGKSDERFDPSFSAEIGTLMQVPKCIRVSGDNNGDSHIHSMYPPSRSGQHSEYKYDTDIRHEMKVPDRILVAGQDQHIGARAPPHELVLENSVLPMGNTGPTFRAQTPPQTITLDALNGATLEEDASDDDLVVESGKLPVAKLRKSESQNSTFAEPPQLALTSSQLTEEVMVLRQQIGRLHRRMAGLERELQQNQHRDALVFSMGAVYLVWKVILWLTRSQ